MEDGETRERPLRRFDAQDMKALARLFCSSLGRKYLMALSGLALVGFVCGHLLGNLQFFLPPSAINRYAHFLQSNLELLWPARLILLALAGLHIWTALTLERDNRAARPVAYASRAPAYGATLASRTMLVSGLIVAAFVVYHLLHFTLKVESLNGTAIPFRALREPGTGYPDVYAMMVAGFSVWYVSLFYIVGVSLLCLHLGHGVAAMFQSLGLRNPAYAPVIARGARWLSLALLAGYVSIPASVLVLGHGKAYLARVVEHSAHAATVAAAGEEVPR